MFPVPWNKAYRAKDGSIKNIADAMGGGGGGSSLPSYSAADAGKVLGVTDEGTLAWVTVSAGARQYGSSNSYLLPRSADTNVEEVTT